MDWKFPDEEEGKKERGDDLRRCWGIVRVLMVPIPTSEWRLGPWWALNMDMLVRYVHEEFTLLCETQTLEAEGPKSYWIHV